MNLLYALVGLVTLAACGERDVMAEIERAEAHDTQAAQQTVMSSEQFLTAAAARPGAVTQPSGLVYEFTKRGPNQSYPHPGPTSAVLVHYEGQLPNGSVFDSSIQRNEPAQFALNQVVPGFSEAIQQMRPGDELIATFPAALGYGVEGHPPVIPANTALRFSIQLIAFQADDGQIYPPEAGRR